MNRPCSCWIAPKLSLHDGHCCFINADDNCHENVLDVADKVTGRRDATLSLDPRSKRRLLAEVIADLYPRSA